MTKGSPRTQGVASEFVGSKYDVHMTIDRIKCDGHGLCAELLPEMIRLDDWGYPIIAPGPVPDRLGPHAQRAVATCPTLALVLRRTARSK